jgi:hypothetical protein
MLRAGAFREMPVMDAGKLVGIVGANALAAGRPVS